MAGQVYTYTPNNAWNNTAVTPGNNSATVTLPGGHIVVVASGHINSGGPLTFALQVSNDNFSSDSVTLTSLSINSGEDFVLSAPPSSGRNSARLNVTSGSGNVSASIIGYQAG